MVLDCSLNSTSDGSEFNLFELTWIASRTLFNDSCTIPDWSGWLSLTSGADPCSLSNIGYVTPIFNSPTDPATVLQCLVESMEAMAELKQKYTFVTFDLVMARIAQNIVWDSPERFERVIVHHGGFRVMFIRSIDMLHQEILHADVVSHTIGDKH